MSRPIKFKVWDVDEKEWYNNEKIPYQLIDSEGVFCWADDYEWNRYPGEVVIVQYTGLKDIKGDDVYHGNLCLYDRNINGKKDKEVFVVEYQDGAFFMDSNNERVYLHDVPETQESIEVIGNIYENPELLGDNQ